MERWTYSVDSSRATKTVDSVGRPIVGVKTCSKNDFSSQPSRPLEDWVDSSETPVDIFFRNILILLFFFLFTFLQERQKGNQCGERKD